MLRTLRFAVPAVLAAAAILLPMSGSAVAAGVGDCNASTSWGTLRGDLAGQVVGLVNQHRAGLGLSTLQVSPTLTAAAEWKARHMAGYGYMAHEDPAPPVARSVGDRLLACGYPADRVGWGENIAMGYPSASSVVQGWLGSPGHRANIENGSYRATGVGVAASSNGTLYWSQEFGTVVDATAGGGGAGGAPAAAPAPAPAPAPAAPEPGPAAPTVTLTGAPPASTSAGSGTFSWTTTGSPTSTTCSVDGGLETPCSSPTSVTAVSPGTHTFRVTVGDSAGNAAATSTWTVTGAAPAPETGAPTVSFTRVPPAYGTDRSASFAWTTTGSPTSTTCTVDRGAPRPCNSPLTLSFGSRRHTLTVRVADAEGASTASTRWYAF